MRPKLISLFALAGLLVLGGAVSSTIAQRNSYQPVPKDFSYPKTEQSIEFVNPLRCKSLSGIVLFRVGSTEKVLVERVTSDWSKRLDATFSDAEGRFGFPDAPRGTYYLKVSKPGFSTLKVKVILTKKSKTQLKLQLVACCAFS